MRLITKLTLIVVFPTATIETLPLLELIVAEEVFELENVLVPLLSVVKVFVIESPYIAVIEELAKSRQ